MGKDLSELQLGSTITISYGFGGMLPNLLDPNFIHQFLEDRNACLVGLLGGFNVMAHANIWHIVDAQNCWPPILRIHVSWPLLRAPPNDAQSPCFPSTPQTLVVPFSWHFPSFHFTKNVGIPVPAPSLGLKLSRAKPELSLSLQPLQKVLQNWHRDLAAVLKAFNKHLLNLMEMSKATWSHCHSEKFRS